MTLGALEKGLKFSMIFVAFLWVGGADPNNPARRGKFLLGWVLHELILDTSKVLITEKERNRGHLVSDTGAPLQRCGPFQEGLADYLHIYQFMYLSLKGLLHVVSQ